MDLVTIYSGITTFKFKGSQQRNEDESSMKLQEISTRRYNIQGFENESTQFLYRMRSNLKLNNVCYSSAINTYEKIIKTFDEAAMEAIGEVDSRKNRNG